MQAAGSRAAAGTSSPHVARLAVRARPAGGPAAAEARDYCAGVLRDLGFAINEHSFQYSAFPGSWAAPLAGAAASLAGIGLFVGRHARGVTAATIALAVAAFALLHALGTRGVLSFPAMRRAGVNLEAVRGVGEPRVWLVAHVDSKRQPVSMVARIAGVVVVAIGAAALVALNVVTLHTDSVAAALLIIVWLGSVPLMLSIVWDGGPGALDNASGVATVLEAAANIAPGPAIGVLITDAEELALAGARAWARDG
ncbi:MAG TPA: M28 family peptidase, partial [Gemmatimonadaceae bacterium]|nr:M28 family peptidase [Gemmatimonadaceae bacterium]